MKVIYFLDFEYSEEEYYHTHILSKQPKTKWFIKKHIETLKPVIEKYYSAETAEDIISALPNPVVEQLVVNYSVFVHKAMKELIDQYYTNELSGKHDEEFLKKHREDKPIFNVTLMIDDNQAKLKILSVAG